MWVQMIVVFREGGLRATWSMLSMDCLLALPHYPKLLYQPVSRL